MTHVLPQCFSCEHFRAAERRCDAFTNTEIPDEIWFNGDPHTEPIDGDNGIRFKLAAEFDRPIR